MLLQTDEILNQSGFPFEKYGCAFMDIAFLCNQISKKTKYQNYLIHIAEEALRLKHIDENLKILRWEKVFELFGVKIKYLGHCKKDRDCKDDEVEILKWTKPKYTHFTCGDGYGHKAYDSLGIRTSSKGYKLDSKRIFEIL